MNKYDFDEKISMTFSLNHWNDLIDTLQELVRVLESQGSTGTSHAESCATDFANVILGNLETRHEQSLSGVDVRGISYETGMSMLE